MGLLAVVAVLVIAIGTHQNSGAAHTSAPAALIAAPEKHWVISSIVVPQCRSDRKAATFYAGRVNYWRTKMGVTTKVRSVARSGCPHYRAHLLKLKAAALRNEYARQLKRQQALEQQHPKWIALRLLKGNREDWNCLLSITWVENRTMDPTLDYGGGHGNVYEAYGIPQATPGTKMASAGPDWRTNPETQLRWMIGYCKARYGSVCGAAYHRRVYGTY